MQQLNKKKNSLVEELGLSEDLAYALLIKHNFNVFKTKEAFLNDPELV